MNAAVQVGVSACVPRPESEVLSSSVILQLNVCEAGCRRVSLSLSLNLERMGRARLAGH